MKVLENILVFIGFALLVLAAYSKVLSKPYLTLGVRLLSLVALANSAFLIAIVLKLSGKK